MAKLSDTPRNQSHKILIYGDSGNGKTIFATSPDGPIKVWDFDGKVESAASYWGRHQPSKLAEIDVDDFKTVPKGSTGADNYMRFYGSLCELETYARNGAFPYKTVVLDSITTWCEELLREILRQNPGVKRATTGVPALQDYGIMNVKFREQLNRILALPCNVIVTGHIDVYKDENTGEILRRPLLPGKLAGYLPIVFGEVYRAYVESDEKGNRKFMAQTQATPQFMARSQIAGLPPKIDLTWSSVTKSY